jgi:hypothetical protein
VAQVALGDQLVHRVDVVLVDLLVEPPDEGLVLLSEYGTAGPFR